MRRHHGERRCRYVDGRGLMRVGSVRFDFGDGEHVFRLAIAQLRELQDKTGVGPATLFDRMASRAWRVDDLRETIRLGLIGGGMEPLEALALVRRYVDERPLLESVEPSFRILMAALVGQADDQVGNGEAENPPQETTPVSGSPSSTGPVPLSDSLPV